MIDNQEVQEIDALEEQILEEGVSYNELRRHYAQFLLDLVNNGRLKNISNEKLQNIVSYLQEAVAREKIDVNDVFIKKLVSELWAIEEQRWELDADLSRLARCVIFCFGSEERWIEDDTGDATPIYIYLLVLKKILPDIRQEFIGFFQKLFKYIKEK